MTEQEKSTLENEMFYLSYDDAAKSRVNALCCKKDPLKLNYIAERGCLGGWAAAYSFDGGREHRAGCSDPNLDVTGGFELKGKNRLVWSIRMTNISNRNMTVSSVKIPLQMNTEYVRKAEVNYTQRLIRHSYISEDGSVIFWQRPDGTFPALVMTCGEGTGLANFGHSEEDKRDGWAGTWYACIRTEERRRGPDGQKLCLAPGQQRQYEFIFQWAEGYAQIRELVYENGKPDVISVPGMVIPQGMDCRLAVRTKNAHRLLCGEGVTYAWVEKSGGYDVYRLRFEKNGRHIITIEQETGISRLEYFSTESVERLLKIRTEHICARQQYRGEKWFDGLISLWDMRKEHMLSPDQRDGICPYCTGGADDPGLCKASVVAAKNRFYPDDREIEAVEYYMERFLWGGLQRTDAETPYPYGIYGSDFWHENRNSGTGYENGGHGMERMWRSFDYTHIIGLYRDMYQIARQYPEKVHYLDWPGYLLRAYHTAVAFFEVPYSIFMKNGWDFTGYCDWAFKQGNFHEIHIPYLTEDLEREGYDKEAAVLRHYWQQKVMYMVSMHPYPFGSEMWFDTTAFESSHVIAKYGMENAIERDLAFYDKNLHGPGMGGEIRFPEKTKADFAEFMEKEIHANLASRDCMTPYCFQMGSDERAGGDNQYLLSYMSQLGGWSIIDYALFYCKKDPSFYMRAGYASYLSSFMLINTGSDYPWYGTEANRGAAGWAFEPEKNGRPWLNMGETVSRSPWPLDGEIDNGFIGAMRTSCSILYRDCVFGPFYLGGHMESDNQADFTLVPADGINRVLEVDCFGIRLSVRLMKRRIEKVLLHVESCRAEITMRSEGGSETYTAAFERDSLRHTEVTETKNGDNWEIITVVKQEKESNRKN